jgi:hypothetical protein
VTSRQATLLVWAMLGAAVVACQIVAARSNGRLPGVGDVVGRLIGSRVVRSCFVLAWMWLGWHAFAR